MGDPTPPLIKVVLAAMKRIQDMKELEHIIVHVVGTWTGHRVSPFWVKANYAWEYGGLIDSFYATLEKIDLSTAKKHLPQILISSRD